MHDTNDLDFAAILRSFDGLTPLAAAKVALLATISPVAPECRPLRDAIGRIVAVPVRASDPHPRQRTALRDGYQVASRDTVGATPYAPTYSAGRLHLVRAGDALGDEVDAVLRPDSVTFGLAGTEILQAVAPGADTRDVGEDLSPGSIIVAAGDRLRPDRLAVLALAGVETVAVRIPRVSIEGSSPLALMIADLALAAGYDVDESTAADMTVVLGLPGYAASAQTVARYAADGRRIAHGLAVRPGDAIGLCTLTRSDGRIRPVVVVPDRLEDVVAAWLLVIEPGLAALAAATAAPKSETLPLAGKIVSAPGLADLVLLRRSKTPSWEPIATGGLTWAAFAAAEAYCVVPPEREGFAAETSLTGIFF